VIPQRETAVGNPNTQKARSLDRRFSKPTEAGTNDMEDPVLNETSNRGDYSSDKWNVVRNRRYTNKQKQSSGVTENESNAASSKPKLPLSEGTKVTNKLKVNKQQVKTKALFVTRLDEGVTAEEMTSYIGDNARVTPIKCTKLKTRYPSYSSFYILVNLNEYDLIANGEFWPEGVLYTQFMGRPRNDPAPPRENSVENRLQPETNDDERTSIPDNGHNVSVGRNVSNKT
jgi:hypothetical protein